MPKSATEPAIQAVQKATAQFAESRLVSQLAADDERLLIELRFENGHAIPLICYRIHSKSSSEVRKSSSGFKG